jgi:nucleoside-diphosphate-sugar epimerase
MLFILSLLEGCDTLENKFRWIVDVRDVVDAILLAYENHKAGGRYICTSHTIVTRDLVEKLKSIYPNYKYHTK